jgi:hypothetical protein
MPSALTREAKSARIEEWRFSAATASAKRIHSCGVEDFSLNRLAALTRAGIDARLNVLKSMLKV